MLHHHPSRPAPSAPAPVSGVALVPTLGTLAPTLGALVLALALTGCSTSRFGGGNDFAAPQQPSNLPAAPSGTVQSGSLPPAVASGPGNIQPIAPGAVPTADPTQTAALQDPAAASASVAPPTASALPVTENTLVGNWTAQAGGGSCSAFFGLTNLGSGLLGGTRGCSGTLTNFRTWQVAGNRATLRDSSGNTVATLTRTADKTLSGTTASGEAVTLTR